MPQKTHATEGRKTSKDFYSQRSSYDYNAPAFNYALAAILLPVLLVWFLLKLLYYPIWLIVKKPAKLFA